jgi:hypothetical protein
MEQINASQVPRDCLSSISPSAVALPNHETNIEMLRGRHLLAILSHLISVVFRAMRETYDCLVAREFYPVPRALRTAVACHNHPDSRVSRSSPHTTSFEILVTCCPSVLGLEGISPAVNSRLSDYARSPAIIVTCGVSSLTGWNSHTILSVRRPLTQSLTGNLWLYGWSLKALYIVLKPPWSWAIAPRSYRALRVLARVSFGLG